MKRGTKGLVAGSIALMALATSTVSFFEGRELRAYQDIVGVWTICEGETKGVKPTDIATNEECDTMTANNIINYEAGLDRCMTGALPGRSKVAVISLTINMGVRAICNSTLVRKVNAGDFVGACNEFSKWVNAGGRVVRGLVIRRAAERQMCLEGLAA